MPSPPVMTMTAMTRLHSSLNRKGGICLKTEVYVTIKLHLNMPFVQARVMMGHEGIPEMTIQRYEFNRSVW